MYLIAKATLTIANYVVYETFLSGQLLFKYVYTINGEKYIKYSYYNHVFPLISNQIFVYSAISSLL